MVEVEKELVVESLDVLDWVDNRLEVLILTVAVDGVVHLKSASSNSGAHHDTVDIVILICLENSLLNSNSNTLTVHTLPCLSN